MKDKILCVCNCHAEQLCPICSNFDIDRMTFSKILKSDLFSVCHVNIKDVLCHHFRHHERVCYCRTGFNRNPITQVGQRKRAMGEKDSELRLMVRAVTHVFRVIL